MKVILTTGADIISMEELQMDQFQEVQDILIANGYHFSRKNVLENNHHMAVFSRHPLDQVRFISKSYSPSIAGRIHLSNNKFDQEFYFFSSFFEVVNDPSSFSMLRQDLDSLAAQARSVGSPVLACGTYNLVSWSNELQTFRKDSGLKSSWRGSMPSSPYGHISLLDRPTQHIFYSDHFKCVSFDRISSFRSAHLGILGTYQFIDDQQLPNVRKTSQKF